jgi:hypothetical protein
LTGIPIRKDGLPEGRWRFLPMHKCRGLHATTCDEEVSLGLTAQQALDLLAFLRSHEQQLRELAAQANDILEHGIPDGGTQEDG